MTIPAAQRAFSGLTLALLSSLAFAQSGNTPATTKPPAFEAADVQINTHHGYHYLHGGTMPGDRYILHDATMVDLVAAAYGVNADTVLGGPSWLELHRFEIVAKTPPNTSPDDIKLMLRTLLADRFHLVAHTGTEPMPVYVLTLGKGKPKLVVADASKPSGCGVKSATSTAITEACHNVTLEDFTQTLRKLAGPDLNNPVSDHTGLKGSWDFDLQWTQYSQQHGVDSITLFDAIDKQLNLKLEAGTAAMAAVVVDSVNETPTPNPPGTAEALPSPPTEFEVAVIKPSRPDEMWSGLTHDGQVDTRGAPLGLLILVAWGINQNMLADAPGWLMSDRWDILAKPPIPAGQQKPLPLDNDTVQPMIRALLADRFKLKAHMEDRPADAFVLAAPNPKLAPSDPGTRSKCWRGPNPKVASPKRTYPIQFSCQNVTMAEFAEQLTMLDQITFNIPVLDSTGLSERYDFTIGYGSSYPAPAGPSPAAASEGAPTPADPGGSVSLFTALREQLGLKLEQQKRPIPMLVIDHVERTPTEN